MRVRKTAYGVPANAIAGAHVVVLGFDISEDNRKDLRGFAMRRTDPAEGETGWMNGQTPFRSLEPDRASGEQFSNAEHPFGPKGALRPSTYFSGG